MPNKVAIVTDSTAYLPEECLQQYNISVTPLSVIWGDQVYRDGVDIMPGEFYTRLADSKVMPTTSQVTPAAMQSIFQSLLQQGYDVLGIFLSSKISGTGYDRSARRSRRRKPRRLPVGRGTGVRTQRRTVRRRDLGIHAARRAHRRSAGTVAVTHANSEADAASLLASARVRLDPVETICCPLSPVIGTHVGPGTVALNFISSVD